MGKFIEIQEARKEVKEKEKVSRETLGKFFYDLAKTSFIVMVAGSAVSFFTDKVQTPLLAITSNRCFCDNNICMYWLYYNKKIISWKD